MDKQKLKEKYFGKDYMSTDKQKRLINILITSGIVLGVLFLSKYLFNAAADSVRAFKNFRSACKGKDG